MENITIPQEVIDRVCGLKLENPSDRRVLELTLREPSEFTQATLAWFDALLRRGGKRYEHRPEE